MGIRNETGLLLLTELLRTGGNSLIATVIIWSLIGDVVPEPKIPAIVCTPNRWYLNTGSK